ncbi:hypothetical protein [uncultured Chryseobacterium sp.]|uniref:hypothetical protein n=1 Tax=uncultured Chryseobacterium sp. TaxID=259322 RepID=UPI0025EF6275|nr:hypothetical protein [uncultured Chryseobacterium sp.]
MALFKNRHNGSGEQASALAAIETDTPQQRWRARMQMDSAVASMEQPGARSMSG